MAVHTCRPSENPRHAHHCACGKHLPSKASTQRNLDLEREITHQAAKGASDPTLLIQHAEARADHLSAEYVQDPMLINPERDWLKEARDELADARNYLAWWIQTHHADEHESIQDILIALRFLALAYDRLTPE